MDTAIPTALAHAAEDPRAGQARCGGAGQVQPRELHHRPRPAAGHGSRGGAAVPGRSSSTRRGGCWTWPSTCRRSSWSPTSSSSTDLARSRPSASYLLPCRGGGVSIEGATTDYLDEHPDRRPWTLIGCERSQQIHEWFYGERAEQVDICPRKRTGGTGAILAKCCLLETHIEVDDGRVVVPWGASLTQISEALTTLAAEWEPTWAPA